MQDLLQFEQSFPKEAARSGLLHVRRTPEASGTPIVMLPGASGTSEFFMLVAPALVEAGLDPILVDYPGTLKPAELCAEVEGLARELELQSPIALGCSYSAYWLQHLASDSVFVAATLANGFVEADDLKDNPLFDHQAISETPAETLSAEWLDRTGKQPDTPLKQLMTKGLTEWLPPEDLKGRLLEVSSAEAVTPDFGGPVAIIDSAEDVVVNHDARQKFRRAWPVAEHINVPGGHYPYVTRPSEFSETVIWWANNNTGR